MRMFFLMMLLLGLGCARVSVQAPKEPIKMDITMRLDIYQHVAKDIDDIENMVSGSAAKAASAENHSRLDYFLSKAYAQDALSPEVEAAALRRKERRSLLVSWQEKGVAGEGSLGLVVVRNEAAADPSVKELVNAENSDRMIIYQALSKKNNVALEEVQKPYAKRLQDDAPKGTPIETLNPSTQQYEWTIKQ